MSRLPFYRGNALINPGYWDTALGQQELRDRQAAATESQLRDLRSEIVRQGQVVQSGSHVFTPEEQHERREAAQAAMAAAESVAPFAATGLIGPDTVRKAIGQAASDTFTDQRTARKAARDMEAIKRLHQNGTHSVEQTIKAVQAAEAEYGQSVLMRVPGYADFVGLGQQLQQAREETLAEFAESRGVDRRFVRWDDRTNAPTYNAVEFVLEEQKSKIAKTKADAIAAPRKDAIDVLKTKLNAVSRAIASAESQGKDASGLYRQFDKLLGEQFKVAGDTAPAKPPRQETVVDQNLSEVIDKVQPPPVAETVGYLKFTSREEATAAAKSGQIPIGKVIMVEGRRAVLRPDGRFVRVQ